MRSIKEVLHLATSGDLDFRGKINGEGRSIYGLTPSYVRQDEILDFSSSTASQATYRERDELRHLLDTHGIEYLDNQATIHGIDQQAFRVVPLSSGSDADLLVSGLLIATRRRFSILSIGIEESGRLCEQFMVMSCESGQFSLASRFDPAKLRSRRKEFNSLLQRFDNIAISPLYHANPPCERLESDIHAYLREQIISLGNFVLLRFNLASKTGILFPSMGFLRELKSAYQDRLIIYSDACQTRNIDGRWAELQRLCDLISISFSKFYQVPSFAGALLTRRNLPLMDSNDLEILCNPYSVPLPKTNLIKTGIDDLPVGTGVRARYSLGAYRFNSGVTESLIKDIASQVLDRLLKYTKDNEDLGLSVLKASHKITTSPTIFNICLKGATKEVAAHIYRSLIMLHASEKRIFVGQPIIHQKNSKLHPTKTIFRISLGYRSYFLSKDQILEDIDRLLEANAWIIRNL